MKIESSRQTFIRKKDEGMTWYVSKFRREQRTRTEFQCPLCGKVGAVEVFQPRLVIFRAEPSIDASIGTKE